MASQSMDSSATETENAHSDSPEESPAAEVVGRGEGWTLRLATPQDEAKLTELARSVELHRDLAVVHERPSFSRMRELHIGRAYTWVLDTDDAPVQGCVTCVLRTAHFAGAVRPVGFLTDVFLVQALQGGRVFPQVALALLEHIRERWSCELFYTLVPEEAEALREALTQEQRGGVRQPKFHPMSPYHVVNLALAQSPTVTGVEVQSINRRQLKQLSRFLTECHADRMFAEVYETSLLKRRFARWPQFSIDSFRVVRDEHNAIIGCIAPWDPGEVRSFRSIRYRGALGWLKGLGTGAATPKPGEPLKMAYLTHFETEDEDPNVFLALLGASADNLIEQGYHGARFVTFPNTAPDRALQGWPVSRQTVIPYAITLPESPWEHIGFGSYDLSFNFALT